MSDCERKPDISVVILNYNGAVWIQRCLKSLAEQTIFDRIEVIVADNLSSDGSDRMAEAQLAGWQRGRFVQNGQNLGYCEGNNRGAAVATGEFLFFLNNDTWLEPNCLEILLDEVRKKGAAAATPLILDYDSDQFQSMGADGFDMFGLASPRRPRSHTIPILMPEGCSYLIQRDLFHRIGQFDTEFFMYGDEMDLSWRVWFAGHDAIAVPASRLHHRSAANVNPAGGAKMVEHRTSDSKRYYSSRNSLVLILKNAQHFLLLLAFSQLVLTVLESLVVALAIRRWSFAKRNGWDALRDTWKLRHHICQARRKHRLFRQRGDWFMARFLRWRPNRWDEVVRVCKQGWPKVAKS